MSRLYILRHIQFINLSMIINTMITSKDLQQITKKIKKEGASHLRCSSNRQLFRLNIGRLMIDFVIFSFFIKQISKIYAT